MFPEPGILSDDEASELRWAYEQLEHPSLAARLSSVIGVPIERMLKLLPQSWYRAVETGAEASISRAARLAVSTLGQNHTTWAGDKRHRAAAAIAGAAGGLAGPLGLLGELPVMTLLMLRSIAAIAHRHGEDLADESTHLACVEVFGLGARSRDDDGAETGYFGLRGSLAFHFGGTLSHQATPGSLPGGVEFLRGVAARFGIALSDVHAARIVPVVGALSGAALNVIFMQHFQDIARGHFIVRRLERKYGAQAIRVAYVRVGAISDQQSRKEYSPLEGW
ncbi:EcsC family protein [Methylolobus aquaticus]